MIFCTYHSNVTDSSYHSSRCKLHSSTRDLKTRRFFHFEKINTTQQRCWAHDDRIGWSTNSLRICEIMVDDVSFHDKRISMSPKNVKNKQSLTSRFFELFSLRTRIVDAGSKPQGGLDRGVCLFLVNHATSLLSISCTLSKIRKDNGLSRKGRWFILVHQQFASWKQNVPNFHAEGLLWRHIQAFALLLQYMDHQAHLHAVVDYFLGQRP